MDYNTPWANYATHWPLFIAIVLGYTLVSLYILGAKKAFFEPYIEKAGDEPTKGE